jgi:Ni,Fe-hydrogenase maturation factor
VQVLALARTLGGALPRVLVVGCEPAVRMTGAEEEVVAELSEPVRAAVDGAASLVESLIEDLRRERNQERTTS